MSKDSHCKAEVCQIFIPFHVIIAQVLLLLLYMLVYVNGNLHFQVPFINRTCNIFKFVVLSVFEGLRFFYSVTVYDNILLFNFLKYSVINKDQIMLVFISKFMFMLLKGETCNFFCSSILNL
jgi:hypothetical protein